LHPALRARNGNGAAEAATRRADSRVTINQRRRRERSHRLLSCIAMRRPGAMLLHASSGGPATQKDHSVTKEELLEFEGLVIEILPDARFRVQLDNGHALIAYTAGRMKKNRIKTLAGDRVTVEVSPYDLEKGRLIFRHKDERAGSVNRSPQRNQFRRR
jgi:translation initiation factor IF-1